MIEVRKIERGSLDELVDALEKFYLRNPGINVLRTHHGFLNGTGEYDTVYYIIIEYESFRI